MFIIIYIKNVYYNKMENLKQPIFPAALGAALNLNPLKSQK